MIWACSLKNGGSSGGGRTYSVPSAYADPGSCPFGADTSLIRRFWDAHQRPRRLVRRLPIDPRGLREHRCPRRGFLGVLGRAKYRTLLGAVSPLQGNLRTVPG